MSPTAAASGPIVCVLGKGGVSQAIQRDLRALGMEVVTLPRPLAQATLRDQLKEFAAAHPEAVEAGVPLLLHPGVTEWAERPELGTAAESLGIRVMAPSPRILTLFSNRLNLVLEAEKVGIPNILLSHDPFHSVREIERHAQEKGVSFPFVLKAVRGAKGMSLFVVYSQEDLAQKVPLWLEQIRGNLGEAILIAERYLEGGRFVTVPFCRLEGGRTEIFPFVDSSLQSRFRKLVELCPASGVDDEMAARLRKWVTDFAESCGYVGLGSLEFMIDGSRAYLLEGLSRLGAGYELWERVAGVNAVEWQASALLGAPPPAGKSPGSAAGRAACGAIARLFSEDTLLQVPHPGRVDQIDPERSWSVGGCEISLSVEVEEGQELDPLGRGWIGSALGFGADRARLLQAMRGVLEKFWIAGTLQTNQRFVAELLGHPWVAEGMIHAGFVDEEFLPSIRPSTEGMSEFGRLVRELQTQSPERYAEGKWSIGDQWIKPPASGLAWAEPPQLARDPRGAIVSLSGRALWSGGRESRVHVALIANRSGRDRWVARIGAWALSVRHVPAAAAATGQASLFALVGGRVHSILYQAAPRAADPIAPHETLVVVESLGQLIPHAVPVPVRVSAWKVKAGERVQPGDELAILDKAK